jgi:hypothetical protein
MPLFHFLKIYGDISRVVCWHWAPDQFMWIPGRAYEWDDLFKEVRAKLATQDRYVLPSIVESFKRQAMATVFFIVLAWYFDNVHSSNRGSAKPFYFFLMPNYWFPGIFEKMSSNKKKTRLPFNSSLF